MTRDDVERIIGNVLRDLTLEMKYNDYIDDNTRTIVLKLNDTEISRVSFDVRQIRED